MATSINLSIPADKVKSYAIDSKTTVKTLNALGINYDSRALDEFRAFASDISPNLVTTPSMMTPVQFLQYWLTPLIKIVTAARDADTILGRTFAGSWEDEEIVQPVIEYTGQARPYGDKTTLNLASFNLNYATRTIVRMEQDVEVGKLEALRASKVRIDALGTKRDAAALSLAISANDIAFYGYNGGSNRTYGLLNDPELGAYISLPNGAAGQSEWSSKTFNEIVADINAAMSRLRVQTGNNFKPERDAAVLVLPVSVMQELGKVNAMGTTSVMDWIRKTFPRLRVESAVQLDGAQAGDNVMYLFAEEIAGNKVIDQFMQDALRLVGVEQKAKNTLESYSNATAGVFVRVPIGVVRYTGV